MSSKHTGLACLLLSATSLLLLLAFSEKEIVTNPKHWNAALVIVAVLAWSALSGAVGLLLVYEHREHTRLRLVSYQHDHPRFFNMLFYAIIICFWTAAICTIVTLNDTNLARLSVLYVVLDFYAVLYIVLMIYYCGKRAAAQQQYERI